MRGRGKEEREVIALVSLLIVFKNKCRSLLCENFGANDISYKSQEITKFKNYEITV